MLVSLVVLTKVTSQLVHGGCQLVHVLAHTKYEESISQLIIALHQAPPLGGYTKDFYTRQGSICLERGVEGKLPPSIKLPCQNISNCILFGTMFLLS